MMESIFFFSSRRRHTRWPRDWSSDVCSSDLYRFILGAIRIDHRLIQRTLVGSVHSHEQLLDGGVVVLDGLQDAFAQEIGRASCRQTVYNWEINVAYDRNCSQRIER